jgi:hypothetical protein
MEVPVNATRQKPGDQIVTYKDRKKERKKEIGNFLFKSIIYSIFFTHSTDFVFFLTDFACRSCCISLCSCCLCSYCVCCVRMDDSDFVIFVPDISDDE